jgi:tRNA(Arg) A34 adenosine deaminase TadA
MNIENLARTVVRLAHKASASGTFGVGGVLVNSEGKIYYKAVNKVVVDGVVD